MTTPDTPTVMSRLRAGEYKTDAEIETALDDALAAWHADDADTHAHEFLGMTRAEYSRYATAPKTFVAAVRAERGA